MATVAVAAVQMGILAKAILLDEEEDGFLEEIEENDKGNKKRKHKVWVRSWIKRREDVTQENTMFKLQRELETEDTGEFRVMMRMPPHVYGELLQLVGPYIQKKNTNFRPSITPDERLSITLRHLALGDCYASLAHQYRFGRCTVGRIVTETCRGIYEALQDDFLKVPQTKADWEDISDIFRERWNFPRVIGAVDGKHIRIVAPPKSGSLYFNFHRYFSIVLLAIADGNYEFLYVDVGAEGRTSDAGLWRETPFCQALKNEELGVPDRKPLRGCEGDVPYMLVADDAFPLGPHVIKPYSHKNLEVKKQIFNYRLSRARRIVENAFGILATRFTIFHQAITARPENATHIVLAAVALHNLLRRRCGSGYIPKGSVDQEAADGTIIPGDWRLIPAVTGIGALRPSFQRNQTALAKNVRDNLADYFLTNDGSIDIQYNNVHV